MPTLHFSISGDFVTKHARDRIFERGWEDAVRFLNENIIDLGLDRAVSILRGENRLKGTNSLHISKEKATARAKVIERTNYTFAGTVFDGTYYWRPYATVNNWGPHDLYNAKDGQNCNVRTGIPSIFVRAKDTTIRNVHYMDDREHDNPLWMKCGDETVCVLWKRVSSVPIWYHAFNTMQWQVALDEYLAIGAKYLDSRGHAQWYPQEKKDTPETEDTPQLDAITKAIEDIREQRASYPPLPSPDRSYTGDAGWILTDGRFFTCNYGRHIGLSDLLMYHIRGVESINAERDAELLGWIKIAHTLMHDKPEHYLLMHEGKMKLSPEQVKALRTWCEKHNEDMPYWFQEKEP